jgi:hypothetical protein
MYKPRRDALPQRHERVLETLVRMNIVPLYKYSLYRLGGEIFVQMYRAQPKMKQRRKRGKNLPDHTQLRK